MRLAACLGLLLLTGCGRGPALYSVTGTVTVDGAPKEGLMVAFAPTDGGTSGAGRTDANGNYTITSTLGKGLPSGTYNVAIQVIAAVDNGGNETSEAAASSDSAAYEQMAASGGMDQYQQAEKQKKANQLPAKYNSATTLQEIVAETDNTIDFPLSSK